MKMRILVTALVSMSLLGACSTDVGRLDVGRLDVGVKHLADQEYAAAKVHFEEMLGEDAGNPHVNLNLGVAEAALGNNEAAERYYRTAIQNGESAPIETTVQNGVEDQVSTTVAALAQRNLELLGP